MAEGVSAEPVNWRLVPRRPDACRAGDEDAFAQIWRACHPSLLRYLRVVVG